MILQLFNPEQVLLALIIAKAKLRELMKHDKYKTENTEGKRGNGDTDSGNPPKVAGG